MNLGNLKKLKIVKMIEFQTNSTIFGLVKFLLLCNQFFWSASRFILILSENKFCIFVSYKNWKATKEVYLEFLFNFKNQIK